MILGHTGEGHGPGDPYGDVNQFISRHGRGAYSFIATAMSVTCEKR